MLATVKSIFSKKTYSRVIGPHTIIIDYKNKDLLENHKWTVQKQASGQMYVLRFDNKTKKTIYLHREIIKREFQWVHEIPVRWQAEHINRDTFNNTISNLKPVTAAMNLQNRKLFKNNKSGYKGVCWKKGNCKWVGYYSYFGKQVSRTFTGGPRGLLEAALWSCEKRLEHYPNPGVEDFVLQKQLRKQLKEIA